MRRLLPVLAALFGLAACGSSDPGGTPPPPPPTGIVATVAVAPATTSLMAPQTVQLTATVKDSAGTALSGHSVSWSASPAGVVTVSSTGLVTAVAGGTATVTATSDGKSGVATIAVGDATLVGTNGGTVSAAGGNVTLIFPAQALASSTTVTVNPDLSPLAAANLVAGTAYDLGPTGMQFAQPVALSIKYNPATLKAGADPSLFRMYLLVGSAWQAVPGSSVDLNAHTVTAAISHFSHWVICQFPCVGDVGQLDLSFAAVPQLAAGGSVTVGGKLFRGGDYVGPVAFSIDGAPTGLTGAVTIGADLITLTMNLFATGAVAPGTYHLTIRATANGGLGVTPAAVPLDVTVPAPAYTASVAPQGIAVAQGATGTTTVTLTRSFFSGTVTPSVENLPAGVTASFNPTPIATTATMTLNVGSSVVPGDYTVTVRTTAAGLPDRTTAVGLTVTGTTASTFTLSGAPAFVSVTAGGTASTGVIATRTGGFGGTITYAVAGLPAGLTGTVTPTAKADSMKLTITAIATVPPGNYSATVTAVSGAINVPLTVPVTVVTSGGLAVHTDFTSCGNLPIWYAVQDGAGSPFVRVPVVNGVVDYTVTSDRIATAEVHGTSTFFTLINYFTRAELTQAGTSTSGPCLQGGPPPTGKIVTGTVKGLAIIDIPGIPPVSHLDDAVFSMGGGTGNALTNGNVSDNFDGGTVQMTGVASGIQDMVAFRRNSVGPGTTDDRVVVRRDLNISNGGSIGLVDFGSAEAVAPATAALTITGATGLVSEFMSYVTGAACAATNPMYTLFSQPAAGFSMFGVPTSLQRSTDFHQVTVTTPSQSASMLFHTISTRAIALWPVLTPAISAATGAYKRLTAVFPIQPDFQYANLSEAAASGNTMLMTASVNVLGAGTSATLAIPDLSAVNGWLPAWSPGSGTLSYNLALSTNNPNGAPTCVDGHITKSAGAAGSN